jgi:hypothetical protein
LISAYPDGAFSPLVEQENMTETAFAFRPPNRFSSYTLIVDNRNNSRPFDADAGQAVTVRMARSAPLRSNPQAQQLLGSLAGACAVILLVGAVVVAAYLRFRRPPPFEDERHLPPRIEVDVEVPPRPRGAWAKAEPPPGEAANGTREGGPAGGGGIP